MYTGSLLEQSALWSEMGKDIHPIVDLDPFFNKDKEGITRATETISKICETYGFFHVVNHRVSMELLTQMMELSKALFALPDEEKMKLQPAKGLEESIPVGYRPQLAHTDDKDEYLLMRDPQLGQNLYPEETHNSRETMDRCYNKLTNLAMFIQEILNDCMGLPSGFLSSCNASRNIDIMAAHRYCPSTEEDKSVGMTEHQDVNILTLLLQDNVGGLQVLIDGKWVPINPIEGSMVVFLGDTIQVLSNNKFKSPMHRVMMNGKQRHSIAFFFSAPGEQWIEPLPHFTTEIGEAPHYRRFVYNDYLQLRARNRAYPPLRPEDWININYYAI